MSALLERIGDRSAKLAVVGLGYVGLPVACAFAAAGFRVTGIDRSEARVREVQDRWCPFAGEAGLRELLAGVREAGRLQATVHAEGAAGADVVIVCVETPVDPEAKRPDTAALGSALWDAGQCLQPGALVIVESTLAPGTMRDVVAPALEKASGLLAGDGFLLAHCPERLAPGRLLANLGGLRRVVGADTPRALEAAAALYATVCRSGLDLTDCLTAEVAKTAENAYRDVQIAFANDLALLCEGLGADAWRVRELVNGCPGRDVLEPGAGVGGACIPKDTWLLLANAGQGGGLLREARRVNDGMPAYLAGLVAAALQEAGRGLKGSTVAVLGYAYREGTGDARGTPTKPLMDALWNMGARVKLHDPLLAGHPGGWRAVVQGADAAVLVTAHEEYRRIDLGELRSLLRTPVLMDGRGVWSKEQASGAGLVYRCVGRG